MDSDLICNYRKCRRRLDSFAWVTSCSHIFCDEDGTREFGKAHTCPACDTSLPGKFDIIKVDLMPSEQYKSMMLAGHKPETVMEIASRALSFWSYQIHQERMYQEYLSSKAKEKVSQLDQDYSAIIVKMKSENNALKSQIAASKKDLECLKKKHGEVTDQLAEKGRQYSKLQAMYDTLRRKFITPRSFEQDSNRELQGGTPRARRGDPFALTTIEDVLGRPPSVIGYPVTSERQPSPAEREFTFQPVTTPVMGGQGDHRYRPSLSFTDRQRDSQ